MVADLVLGSLHTLINILVWLIFLRVIMSWIRPDPMGSAGQVYYQVFSVVYELTEPLLGPIRGIMPGGGMGIDFSPIILLFILRFIQQVIAGL